MKILPLAAGLVLAAAPAASAQDANAWMEKLSKLAGKSFTTDMTSSVESEAMTMSMKGSYAYADAKKFAMDMAMKITNPAMGMNDPMDMKMKMVADGTTLWMEMESPMMGGQQVMKLGVDHLDKLEEMGMSMNMSGSSEMDPVAQVKELASMADFGVPKVENGKVILSGPLNEKGLENLSEASTQMGIELTDIMIVLDEKTAFPQEFALSAGDQKVVTSSFSNTKFPEEIDPSRFSYTPPEGVDVMDLGAMMGG